MLTLAQMFNKTESGRKDRALQVQVLRLKTGYTEDGFGYVAAQTYSRYRVDPKGKLVLNKSGNKYVTVVTFLDKKLHCLVSCSCGDNTFRFETANSYKNAAIIEYSNGAAPNTTNPNYKAGLCKHLCSLYLKIKPKLPA